MRVEISALFHLQQASETPVNNAEIGSGVFIQRLSRNWLNEVKSQCPKIEAREQVESLKPYTHRFFYEIESEEEKYDDLNLATSEDKQLILRAIVLSRIVKPTSIGYDSVWVKTFYCGDGDETIKHYHNQDINNLNLAYLIGGDEDWNSITDNDAVEMAELWDSLQFFLDDANEPKYRRIVRAIKFNEYAYAVYFAEISHPTFHSALESMICTGHKHNKSQIVQRLPQLVSFINQQQAEDIYLTCCGFKHSAEAMLQNPLSVGEVIAPSDQNRLDAVKLLRRAIRDLLVRALRDRSFADILANPNLLRNTFPVYDNKGKLV